MPTAPVNRHDGALLVDALQLRLTLVFDVPAYCMQIVKEWLWTSMKKMDLDKDGMVRQECRVHADVLM